MALGLPSLDDVVAILRFHLGRDLPDDDLGHFARRAPGCTGADIANIVRQAHGTAYRPSRPVRSSDLSEVLEDVVGTIVRRS